MAFVPVAWAQNEMCGLDPKPEAELPRQRPIRNWTADQWSWKKKKKAMLITVGHKDFCGYYAAKADGYND